MEIKKTICHPCLAAGVLLGLAVSLIIAGCSGLEGEAGSVTATAPLVLLEIPGNTSVVEGGVPAGSGIVETLEIDYGPLNIPRTVKKFDIVQFDGVVPEDLKVLIHGKEYAIPLERMNFESIDDGIDSYSGKIEGFDDSVVLLTFSGNIVTGSIEFAGETIFISPIQNRENAEKTEMPLHIVYSSKNMDQPGLFGGF